MWKEREESVKEREERQQQDDSQRALDFYPLPRILRSLFPSPKQEKKTTADETHSPGQSRRRGEEGEEEEEKGSEFFVISLR